MAKLPSRKKVLDHTILQVAGVVAAGFVVLLIKQSLKKSGKGHLAKDFGG